MTRRLARTLRRLAVSLRCVADRLDPPAPEPPVASGIGPETSKARLAIGEMQLCKALNRFSATPPTPRA